MTGEVIWLWRDGNGVGGFANERTRTAAAASESDDGSKDEGCNEKGARFHRNQFRSYSVSGCSELVRMYIAEAMMCQYGSFEEPQ